MMRRRIALAFGLGLLGAAVTVTACTSFGTETPSGPPISGGGADADADAEADADADATSERPPEDDGGSTDTGLLPLPNCNSAILDLAHDDFSSLKSSWEAQIEGAGKVAALDGVLRSEVPLHGPVKWWAHLLDPFEGTARFGGVRYRMRLLGRSPAAHVGCKLVFGTIGYTSVQGRLVANGDALHLEIASDSNAERITVLTSIPDDVLRVSMDVVPAPGGFRAVATIGSRDGVETVETNTLTWNGGAPPLGGLRCGIMETVSSPASGSLIVLVDDVSAAVCAD